MSKAHLTIGTMAAGTNANNAIVSPETAVVPPTPLADLPTVNVSNANPTPLAPVVQVQPALTFMQQVASCCRGFSSTVLIPIAIQVTDTGEDILRNVINTYIDSKSNLSPQAKELAKQANIAATKAFETAIINSLKAKQTEWSAEGKNNKLVQEVAAVIDKSGVADIAIRELEAAGNLPGAKHVTSEELSEAGIKAADTAAVAVIASLPKLALNSSISLTKEEIAIIVKEAVAKAGFNPQVATRILESEAGKAAVYRMIQTHNEDVIKNIIASVPGLNIQDDSVRSGAEVVDDHSNETDGARVIPRATVLTEVGAATNDEINHHDLGDKALTGLTPDIAHGDAAIAL